MWKDVRSMVRDRRKGRGRRDSSVLLTTIISGSGYSHDFNRGLWGGSIDLRSTLRPGDLVTPDRTRWGSVVTGDTYLWGLFDDRRLRLRQPGTPTCLPTRRPDSSSVCVYESFSYPGKTVPSQCLPPELPTLHPFKYSQ